MPTQTLIVAIIAKSTEQREQMIFTVFLLTQRVLRPLTPATASSNQTKQVIENRLRNLAALFLASIMLPQKTIYCSYSDYVYEA